jgi:hypothetical protein
MMRIKYLTETEDYVREEFKSELNNQAMSRKPIS